jgi:hypothetical protein
VAIQHFGEFLEPVRSAAGVAIGTAGHAC